MTASLFVLFMWGCVLLGAIVLLASIKPEGF